MNQRLLLNDIYQTPLCANSQVHSCDKKVNFCFNENDTGDVLIAKLLLPADTRKDSKVWSLIENWQALLAVALILYERNELKHYVPQLNERLRCLNACYVWQGLQVVSIYKTICAYLLGQPAKELVIHQNENGAAPLEWGKHWSWADVPHSRFHAELGFLWCLYGNLTGNLSYIQAAESVANWLLNTLNHNFLPFLGLYSQEEDACESRLLINNFLLFSAVATFAAREDMCAIAEKHYKRLNELATVGQIEFSPLQTACDRWLNKYSQVSGVLPTLPNIFQDKQLALTGCRSTTGSVFSTLTGGSTGLGAMCRGDVEIISFGPQHLPLGDCRGFGIESCQERLSESQIISDSDNMYSLQGMVRLSPYPKASTVQATFRNGEHSGFWMDVKQVFQDGQLTIDTIFRGLFEVGTLAFVMFVKACSCVVENSKINLRSFERYQGEVKNVLIQGQQSRLTVEAHCTKGEMQVIPLGGGNNFWGADFLIAYLLDSQETKYSWIIK